MLLIELSATTGEDGLNYLTSKQKHLSALFYVWKPTVREAKSIYCLILISEKWTVENEMRIAVISEKSYVIRRWRFCLPDTNTRHSQECPSARERSGEAWELGPFAYPCRHNPQSQRKT